MLNEKISQKISEQHFKPGLYLVSTPIGNIFDISLRAIYILKNSKVIFAEDTRNSKNLLNFYEIKSNIIACHEYNETDLSVTSKISSTEIFSLISDAGTPAISDPGYKIVNWCLEHNINVYAVPGASAVLTSLCVSGFPGINFSFFGFLPNKSKARKSKLSDLSLLETTLIFLESPNRIVDFLKDALEVFGDRKCVISRELTKMFEETKRGRISEMLEYFSKDNKGEFVIIIQGFIPSEIDENFIVEILSEKLKNFSLKDAVKIIVHDYNLPKNEVYEKALKLKNEK